MTLLTIAHRDRTLLIPLIFELKAQVTRHLIVHDEAEEDRRMATELAEAIRKMNEKYG